MKIRMNLFSTLLGTFVIGLIFGLSTLAMAEEPITLRVSSFVPPIHYVNTGVLKPWIELVEKNTHGKVKIKLYTGGALGKPQDQYDMAVRGIADITWGILAYSAGRFPLAMVMELPFISPSTEIGSRIMMKLWDEGYLKSEFDDVKVLALGMGPLYDLHTKTKPVKSLEDMKGMKIRAHGAMMGSLIRKWGGVPVAMPLSECYLSLERGVIDGTFLDMVTFMSIRADEVTRYHTKVGVTSAAIFFVMNKNTWARLPSDVQKVINDFSGEYWAVELSGKGADKLVVENGDKLKAEGHPVYTLPPKEMEKWRKTASEVTDNWVKGTEAKGLPGKKILERAVQLRDEFTK